MKEKCMKTTLLCRNIKITLLARHFMQTMTQSPNVKMLKCCLTSRNCGGIHEQEDMFYNTYVTEKYEFLVFITNLARHSWSQLCIDNLTNNEMS